MVVWVLSTLMAWGPFVAAPAAAPVARGAPVAVATPRLASEAAVVRAASTPTVQPIAVRRVEPQQETQPYAVVVTPARQGAGFERLRRSLSYSAGHNTMVMEYLTTE